MDPLCEKYYHISPYVYCAGNPVKYVNPDERLITCRDDDGNRWTYNYEKGVFENQNGDTYSGGGFLKTVTTCLSELRNGEAGNILVEDLSNREERVAIAYSDKKSGERSRDNNIRSAVLFKPDQIVDGGTDYTTLGHELAHSKDRLDGTMLNDFWFKGAVNDVDISERYAMHWENLIRAEHKLPLREFYSGSNGRAYKQYGKDEYVSEYFESKYPYNVNYRNKLDEGVKGYVYKSYKK